MTVSIGLYEGEGANPVRLQECLQHLGCRTRRIGLSDLLALEKLPIEVLYLPGGWYQFDDAINRKIIEWVKSGGGVVGTCAGAYLVGAKIGLFPSRVLRCNFRGRLYLEPQRHHPILDGVAHPCTRHGNRPHGEQIAVTHLGGPMIFPGDKETIVASYDFEGEVGAIVAAEVGQGRAVALASHPELPLAEIASADTLDREDHAESNLPQGDARLLIRNSVWWAARRVDD